MLSAARALLLTLCVGLGGCRSHEQRAAPSSAPSSSANARDADAHELRALLLAEQRRDARGVDPEMLSSRLPALRRAAARALARIGDAQGRDALLRALTDEDPSVVRWSAFGLGQVCQGAETELTRALVLRAAELRPSDAPNAPEVADAVGAIADALGRCANDEAEHSLRAWLRAEPIYAQAAAFGLGRLAHVRGRLEDVTLVALLDAVARHDAPIAAALYPFGELGALAPSAATRLLDVARPALHESGEASQFALGALVSAGEQAAELLGDALASRELSAGQRASAARALGRLGERGQRTLSSAVQALTAQLDASAAELTGAGYAPLFSALSSLHAPLGAERRALQKLSSLPLGADTGSALARREILLRCRAASLLAGPYLGSPELRQCDPDPHGRQGALALIAVLDRAPIVRERARRFADLARSEDAPVREAALELLATHREIPRAADLLGAALGSPAPGVVASAARLVARYPDRAASAPKAAGEPAAGTRPDPALIAALTHALGNPARTQSVELATDLLDAAGALGLLAAKDDARAACRSEIARLREHAEKALRLLGDREQRCDAHDPLPRADEAERAGLTGRYRLHLQTDTGELELRLDAALAPVAVARVVSLARAGFYDDLAVHRVIPGFVVQFGDRGGDGFGTAALPPLHSETSPLPFVAGAVGVAHSGRDTGSSQLFVTLGRYPRLDGEYTLLGQAGPGWDALAEGDRIQHVDVSTLPDATPDEPQAARVSPLAPR